MKTTEWTRAIEETRAMLRRLCGTPDHDPSYQEFTVAGRDLFAQMGWNSWKHNQDSWASYLGAAHTLLSIDLKAPDRPVQVGDVYHNYLACLQVLGIVDAPWVLDPLPRHGFSKRATYPPVFPFGAVQRVKVSVPEGWPAPTNGAGYVEQINRLESVAGRWPTKEPMSKDAPVIANTCRA